MSAATNLAVVQALRQQLDTRFPTARPLAQPKHGVVASGIDLLDELLPGGLPRGAMSVVVGEPSSGKSALAARWVAAVTQAGRTAAWVGAPLPSAAGLARQGVDLKCLLAVRGAGDGGRKAAEALLESGVFDLLILDDDGKGNASSTAWPRLQRAAAGSRQALLVIADPPPLGDPLRYYAAVVLNARRERGAGIRLELLKSRFGKSGSGLRLDSMPDQAGFPILPELPGLLQAARDL